MNTEMKIVYDRKIRLYIILVFVLLLPIISGCHKNNEVLDSNKYALPIVDHAKARLTVIALYKKVLTESKQMELF